MSVPKGSLRQRFRKKGLEVWVTPSDEVVEASIVDALGKLGWSLKRKYPIFRRIIMLFEKS